MGTKNNEKGRHLEQAVGRIQEAILSSDPKFKGISFSVEFNKIFSVAGVRHEIDVLVKTLPDSQFESTWLFECKNWKDPVGKNEVIILAEKVNALAAARGFLVAREFTRDARAKAESDSRLKLVECTDDFIGPIKSVELYHTITDLLPVRIHLKQRGIPPAEHPHTLDWKGKPCTFQQKPGDFISFVEKQVREQIHAVQDEKSGTFGNDGTHWGECSWKLRFDSGEFSIGETDVEWMTMAICFFVSVRRPKLISKFEVKEQGRAYFFEGVETGAAKVEISLVQRI